MIALQSCHVYQSILSQQQHIVEARLSRESRLTFEAIVLVNNDILDAARLSAFVCRLCQWSGSDNEPCATQTLHGNRGVLRSKQ